MRETATLPDIQYHSNPGLLTVRWFAEADFAMLQQHYSVVLEAGMAHGTTRWLLDLRRRSAATSDGLAWLFNTWLPQAHAAVAPHVLCLAYLVLPQRAEALEAEPVLQAARQHAARTNNPCGLRTFCDEGEAVRWLTTLA